MTKHDSKPAWLNHLEWNVLTGDVKAGGRVYEVVIKIRPSGLLAIIKIVRGDGPYIAFAGARGLAALSREIRNKVAGEDTPWRADKFATFDKK